MKRSEVSPRQQQYPEEVVFECENGKKAFFYYHGRGKRYVLRADGEEICSFSRERVDCMDKMKYTMFLQDLVDVVRDYYY